MVSRDKFEALFLVSGGIGNAIEVLYALEYCQNAGVRVALYLSNINESFRDYLRECYGERVILSFIENVETKYLIHSFTFQEELEVKFEHYFYIQPDYHSSKRLSETEQYLSVVRALFPSDYQSYILKHLEGAETQRVKRLNSENKVILCAGGSPQFSVKRWPHYYELADLLGWENILFIGGNDDMNFDYSFIYPKYLADFLPQKILNNKRFWDVLKTLRVLQPYAHHHWIRKNKNAFLNVFEWGELVAIFKNCKQFIGNDTGLMHLASAVGAKGAAIFGPTSVDKNKPYNPNVTALSKSYPCQPCQFGVSNINMSPYLINCPYQVRCLTNLSAGDVLNHLQDYSPEGLEKFAVEKEAQEVTGVDVENKRFRLMHQKTKNILFTFDYELFLGNTSGTVDHCLIQPTERILSLLDKYHLRAIFFIDTAFLIRLKSERVFTPTLETDYDRIVQQIRDIAKFGHYIFPHLHPHWLDAQYDEAARQWKLTDVSKYRFHNLSGEERALLFQQSFDLFKEILTADAKHYFFEGYRAGGWSIQPFQDFKPYFEQYGTKYEFSVMPGRRQITNCHHFDFINAPPGDVYKFSEDVLVEDKEGRFVEFTISKVKYGRVTLFLNKLFLKLWKTSKWNRRFGEGETVVPVPLGANAWDSKKETGREEVLSLENVNMVKLFAYLAFAIQHRYLHFTSHPKMFTRHSLFVSDLFLGVLTKLFPLETDFKKIEANVPSAHNS